MTLEERLQDLDVKLAVLTKVVEDWMTTTSDYRQNLCSKINEVKETADETKLLVAKLPCDERVKSCETKFTELKSLKDKVDDLIFRGMIALISFGVAYGVLTQTVTANSGRISHLEVIHPRADGKYLDVNSQGKTEK